MTKREIFKKAWKIRKATASAICCKVSEVSMGDCLKIVYKQYKEIAEFETVSEIVFKATKETLSCFSRAQLIEMVNSTEWNLWRRDLTFGCIRLATEMYNNKSLIRNFEKKEKYITIDEMVMNSIETLLI